MERLQVLVVGAGMTGAMVASRLTQQFRTRGDPPPNVTVWTRRPTVGGRMKTITFPASSGATADLGAQYVTRTPEYAASHRALYEDLLASHVLEPLEPGLIEGEAPRKDGQRVTHFAAPAGIASVVRHVLDSSGARVECDRHVISIAAEAGDSSACVHVSPAGRGGAPPIPESLRATCRDGTTAAFDAVVFTAPAPQLLRVTGLAPLMPPDVRRLLAEDVAYSRRHAVALCFPEAAPRGFTRPPWAMRYVTGNDCVRFVCFDNVKRGRPDLPLTVVVHTGVPFTMGHVDDPVENVVDIIVENLYKVVPELPPLTEAVKVEHQVWLQSQVHKGYPGAPGCVVAVETRPWLLITGDAFSHGNMDGAAEAGTRTADTLISILDEQSKG